MGEGANQLKYDNYTEQMGRLKKAMANHFLLEALFIEYAVIEDRTESILRHAGVFNQEKHTTLCRKLNRIADLARSKKSLLNRCITIETVEGIRAWKDDRNRLIHALMKQDITTRELEQIAEEGQKYAKLLCARATSFRRAVEREWMKRENGG